MKKACEKCKMFVEGDECPVCKARNFSTTWKGRLHILDMQKSDIAKKIDVHANGEYAIKIK